ncbi:MAG: hypothetical protein GC180_09515 [Bacteroidetes bacterium]|nr:hypothetical protein [Bacteroidota bacterium]
MPNEVSIAVNHLDESYIVVGSNINNLYSSADSGQSWKEFSIQSTFGIGGDPCLNSDDSGIFYYAHLSRTPGKKRPEWYDRMVVHRSLDGGQSWNEGVGVGFNNGKMQDKEWLCSDGNSSSPYKGNLYISWTEFDEYNSSDPDKHSRIRFARSTDRGLSFEEPVVVSDMEGNCEDDDQTVEGATVAIGPFGEIYIVWAGNGKLWMDVSLDGGKTFGVDKVIADLHEGWTLEIDHIYRSNGMPFIACNPQTGEIWVCFSDRKEGEVARINLLRSPGDLSVWTTYNVGNPDMGDVFFPNVCLNPRTGQVGVVYYQCRGKKKMQVDLYLLSALHAPSHQTLSKPFKRPGKKVFFGDYIDLDYIGKSFIATWTSFEKKKLVVRVKRAE